MVAPLPPVAPRKARRLCAIALVGFAVFLAVFSALAIHRQGPDFEYFHAAGASLLTHGQLDRGLERLPGGCLERRGTIEWYLPFVSRLMALVAWLPFRAAGGIWLTLNLIAFFATLMLLGRHLMGLPPQDWPVTLLVPVLLLGLFWHWEFRLNQIDNLTLLLLVASFVHWQARRPRLAGLWLGLAVLLKITPVLLVVWFALKRQFRTVGVALATIVLAGPVGDLVVFRPATTAEVYGRWFETAVVNGSHRGLILNQQEMDWRNQGLGAVACRWLTPTNYARHFDNDPRIKMNKKPAFMNLVAWPRATVATIVLVLVAVSVAALLWLVRRPARDLSLWQLRAEWALMLLAMLWLMPVLRRYHLVLMLPAMAVLASGIHYAGRIRWSKLALAGVFTVALCQLLILTRELPEMGILRWLNGVMGAERVATLSKALDAGIVEASGVLLLSVVLLAIPTVVLLVRLGHDPNALPAHAYAPPHPVQPLPSAGDKTATKADTVATRA